MDVTFPLSTLNTFFRSTDVKFLSSFLVNTLEKVLNQHLRKIIIKHKERRSFVKWLGPGLEKMRTNLSPVKSIANYRKTKIL